MGHVHEAVHVDAPIEQVWELNVDCRRLPEWNVNVVEVRDCPDRLDRIGARYTSVGKVLGRRVEGTWEVTKLEKPRRIALHGAGMGGGEMTVDVAFGEASSGTDVTIDVDYEFGGLMGGMAARLLGPSIERDIRHSNDNFKAICEATARATA